MEVIELITQYTEICLVCGKRKTDTHHLINASDRDKATDDDLLIPLCHSCHMRLHDDALAMSFSKMLGQIVWEKEYYRKGGNKDAREQFRSRYGKSYL